MEREMIRIPVADIRGVLQELCAYIPYFEVRVGGTFRFQYWDEETGELKDMEGYEESNRHVMFPDPVSDDETWHAFRELFLRKIWEPFLSHYDGPVNCLHTKTSDRSQPEHQLIWLLQTLAYAVVHERLCTGYTTACMKDGTYLKLLMQIKGVLS